MSVFILQIIAMITMLTDHLGMAFFDGNVILRSIGRFAFPIYAFLLAEGFRHFKDDKERVSEHLGWYIILALVSEFCYDLLESKPFVIEKMVTTQNAIITLLLAFLGLMAIEKWKDSKPVFMWATIALTALMNYLVLSNYKFAGVLLVYGFYYYLEHYEGKSYLMRLVSLLAIFVCYLPIYHWARYNFCDLGTFIEKLQGPNVAWYLMHIAIAVVLASYKGKLGFYSRKFKLVYKFFYPVHLLILGIIFQLMG